MMQVNEIEKKLNSVDDGYLPLEKQKHYLENKLDFLVLLLLFLNTLFVVLPNLYVDYYYPTFIDIPVEEAITFIGINFSYYFYEFHIYVMENYFPWIEMMHHESIWFWVFVISSLSFWVTYFFIPVPFFKIPYIAVDNIHNRRRSLHKKLHITLYLMHLDKSFKSINKIDFKKFMTSYEKKDQVFNGHPLFVNELKELYQRYFNTLRIKTDDKYILGLDSTVQDDVDISSDKVICVTGKTLNMGLNKGTILFDEIGDLCEENQIALLRVLEEREYYPVGSNEPKTLNARIVSATHKAIDDPDLFRQDLYFRIAAHKIELPPLRERKGDVSFLSHYFLMKLRHSPFSSLNKSHVRGFEVEAMEALQRYEFLGNVRDLQSIISSALVVEKSNKITLESLPKKIRECFEPEPEPEIEIKYGKKEVMLIMVHDLLKKYKGNVSRVADVLNVSRSFIRNCKKKM